MLEEVSPAAVQKNMSLLIKEMEKAGIWLGIAPVRGSQNGDNDEALLLMESYPGRFLGIPCIDPLNPAKAVEKTRKYCLE